MNSILKMLVAIACLMIIAAGGYYLWSVASEARLRAEQITRLENARVTAFDFAKAKPDEIGKVQRACKYWNSHVTVNDSMFVAQFIINCRTLGYL